jgi:hypothetical protein
MDMEWKKVAQSNSIEFYFLSLKRVMDGLVRGTEGRPGFGLRDFSAVISCFDRKMALLAV